MNKRRTIFIGDIHGCYIEFRLLLDKLDIQESDKIYLVGDMINKGPDSYKVLKYIYKNRKQFFPVKGNNEMWFLRFLKEHDSSEDLTQYIKLRDKIFDKGKQKYIDYLESLPLFIEEDNFIMVHGGIIPGKKLEDHDEHEITRLREYEGKPWYEYYTGEKLIIYGHWAQDGIRIGKNTIGLDSGCVYGKALTGYVLETGEITQQTALDLHINVFENDKEDYESYIGMIAS